MNTPTFALDKTALRLILNGLVAAGSSGKVINAEQYVSLHEQLLNAMPPGSSATLLFQNYDAPAKGERNGPGLLEIGQNDQGEVVLNLPADLTGHIVFSPDQADNVAGILMKHAAEIRKERPSICDCPVCHLERIMRQEIGAAYIAGAATSGVGASVRELDPAKGKRDILRIEPGNFALPVYTKNIAGRVCFVSAAAFDVIFEVRPQVSGPGGGDWSIREAVYPRILPFVMADAATKFFLVRKDLERYPMPEGFPGLFIVDDPETEQDRAADRRREAEKLEALHTPFAGFKTPSQRRETFSASKGFDAPPVVRPEADFASSVEPASFTVQHGSEVEGWTDAGEYAGWYGIGETNAIESMRTLAGLNPARFYRVVNKSTGEVVATGPQPQAAPVPDYCPECDLPTANLRGQPCTSEGCPMVKLGVCSDNRRPAEAGRLAYDLEACTVNHTHPGVYNHLTGQVAYPVAITESRWNEAASLATCQFGGDEKFRAPGNEDLIEGCDGRTIYRGMYRDK